MKAKQNDKGEPVDENYYAKLQPALLLVKCKHVKESSQKLEELALR